MSARDKALESKAVRGSVMRHLAKKSPKHKALRKEHSALHSAKDSFEKTENIFKKRT